MTFIWFDRPLTGMRILPRIPNDRTRSLLRGGCTLHHRPVSHSNHGQSDYVAFIVAHAQTHASINPLIQRYRSRECVWEESVAQWHEFVATRQGWNEDGWECMADQWERIKKCDYNFIPFVRTLRFMDVGIKRRAFMRQRWRLWSQSRGDASQLATN